MNNILFITDPIELSVLKLKVLTYILKNEVTSFLEGDISENHIFVIAVKSSELYLCDKNSDLYKIGELTNCIINNPSDYDKAEELAELVDSLTEDPNELLNMF